MSRAFYTTSVRALIVLLVCACTTHAAVIWRADFESYSTAGTDISSADETDDNFFYILTNSLNVTAERSDSTIPLNSGMVAKVVGLAGGTKHNPEIKIGNFSPAFGDSNGDDVMVISADVYAVDDDNDARITLKLMDTNRGTGGGVLSSCQIPDDEFIRLTLVANRSGATVNLPDFDGDGTVDANEQLADNAAILYYRDSDGDYTISKTRTGISVDLGGVWWCYHTSYGDNSIYYDNFIVANSLDTILNGSTIAKAKPGQGALWRADFETYPTAGTDISTGDAQYDKLNFILTNSLDVESYDPDWMMPFNSGMVAEVVGLVGGTKIDPEIKIGTFDDLAIGQGNGDDVLIISGDVYADCADETTIMAFNLIDDSGGAGGGAISTRTIPSRKFIRVTLVANRSGATINLPDFDGDETVDTNEQLADDVAVVYYRTKGGAYTIMGTFAVLDDLAGTWWRFRTNYGANTVYYDNFIACSKTSDLFNGIPVLEQYPGLNPPLSGLVVTNEHTGLQGGTPETLSMAVGITPYETSDTVDWVIDDMEGLTTVTTLSSTTAYSFSLSETARGYFAFFPRLGFEVPAGFKLYREDAVEMSYHEFRANIYYKDFAATTTHTVSNTDNTSVICLGFRALSEMEDKQSGITTVCPTDYDKDSPETWVLRTTETKQVKVVINNPTGSAISSVDLKWKLDGEESWHTDAITSLSDGDTSRTISLSSAITSEGFYWGTFELWMHGEKLTGGRWPIAYFDKPTSTSDPDFIVGVYDKWEQELWDPVKHRVYRHAIFHKMITNNINTLVVGAYWNPDAAEDFYDLAEEYGCKMIKTVGNPLNGSWDKAGPTEDHHAVYTHSALVALKYGDEPLDQDDLDAVLAGYAAIQTHYSTPIITCLIGESVDEDDTWSSYVWEELESEIRFIRNYPIRRTYDLTSTNWDTTKLALPIEESFALYESMETTPWWYISQAFGKGTAKHTDSYWRQPTRAEHVAMSHIALANGARALIPFALNSSTGDYDYALFTQELIECTSRDSTKPIDAVKYIAGLTKDHAALLSRHEAVDVTVTADDDEVSVFPRQDPNTGVYYLYVINRDCENTATDVTITLGLSDMNAVEDIYTGDVIAATDNGSEAEVTVTLAPGEGQFWRLDHDFVANWSFEIDDDEDGEADDWYPMSGTWPANASLDTSEASHGDQSLKIVGPCEAMRTNVMTLTRTTANDIVFSARSKSSSASGGYYIHIYGRYNDANQTTFSITKTTSGLEFTQGTHDWETKTYRWTPADAVLYVRMVIYGPTTGTAWFDEIVCQEE
jgi:hypothetical protein